jgi:hypothetical protein
MKKLFILLSLFIVPNLVTTSCNAFDYKSLAMEAFKHVTSPAFPMAPAYKKITVGVAAAGAAAVCGYDAVSMSVDVLSPGYIEFQGRLHSYSAVAGVTMAIISACFLKWAANDLNLGK